MARCGRCGIETEAAVDLEPEFCEACIEDFLDEDDDDSVAYVEEHGLPSLEWMNDEPA